MTGVWLAIAAFGLLLAIGFRSIWRNGRKREALLYAAVVVWCAFIAVPGIAGHKPLMSPVAASIAIFSPIGKLMYQLLGSSRG
ncbi:hypothetical protein ACFPVX_17505 [Cohnella faecalis]|uniref:Uncharacterized protein n=1 Tax=Cohnella faecalis TaxID=2315694 RepID=A0A398CG63_9BACL|nr:hypothetical protein [Cohnella faecalis]RIE01490.1 hypothetical protein D3H35_24360 [Cohnella faecalis]